MVSLEALSHWNFQFLPISLSFNSGSKKLGSGINSILTPQIYSVSNDVLAVFWAGLAAGALCLVVDITFFIFELRAAREEEQTVASKTVDMAGILRFPKIFWLLILFMGLFLSAFNSFFVTASGMAQTRFNFTVNEAGLALVLSF